MGNLLSNLFRGKLGLAKTYWIWGVLGGVFVSAVNYAALYLNTKYISDDTLQNGLEYLYSSFVIAWGLFISIAIINSAAFNRKRGFWGWIASAIAAFGILKSVQMAGVMFGLMPQIWSDFERDVAVENLALPTQAEDGIILEKMTAHRGDKSVVIHIAIDTPTLEDGDILKDDMLEECDDVSELLQTAKKLVYKFRALDNTSLTIEILREDCG